MKPTNENSYNDIGIGSLTDDFLLLVLKNLKFREKEIKEEIKMVEEETKRRKIKGLSHWEKECYQSDMV